MARRFELTGGDLARPAKELPLKTIKNLGYLLHTHLHNSGNWETVAEDLGYCYEAIKQFSTNANVRQDSTPGEIMLRDWIGRGTGRTLFVLRNALYSSDRRDGVEYLDQEINDKILHMDLHVCFAEPNGTHVTYLQVRTRSDASLRDSLQNVLDGPVRNYQLADSGASWDCTIAREYKGQELKIYCRQTAYTRNQEQDPTIDSSCQSVDSNCSGQGPHISSNELNRSIRMDPVACHSQHLNIPTSVEKKSNVSIPRVESSQHCHSCTCQAGSQPSPNIIRKSRTIFDDQDLTRQELQHLTQRPRTFKLELSTTSSAPDSVTFQKQPNYCGIDSLIQSDNVNVDSSGVDSLTFQKRLAENVNDTNNFNLREVSVAHSIETGVDSVTKQKELVMCSRKMQNLVAYTPSSSSSGSAKGSLEHNFKTINSLEADSEDTDKLNESRGLNETCVETDLKYTNKQNMFKGNKQNETVSPSERFSGDLPIYSYALCTGNNESHIQEENYMYSVDRLEADSSMDIKVINNHKGKTDTAFNEINFVNVDLMDNEQYGSSWENKSVSMKSVRSVEGFEDRSSYSEMDCQSLTDVSEMLPLEDENTPVKTIISGNTDNYRRSICLDMDSAETYNGSYAQQSENTHLHNSNNASNTDIADLVDDSAIQVVNLDKADNSEMIDIYATSVIPELEKVQHQECDSVRKHGIKGHGQGHCFPYESLQRFVSCPNDFGYEEPTKQIKFQKVTDNVEMPTIADAFTPVTEHLRFQDLLTKGGNCNSQFGKLSTFNGPTAVNSLDRPNKGKTKIQMESTPNRRSCTDVNRIKTNVNRKVVFTTNTNTLGNRPLPAPPSADLDRQTGQGQPGSSRISPPPLPPKVPKLSPHPYKLVSAGKTSRPMLDNLLTNDKLFIHYNTCLQGYPGWNPRETEYTVEKTLQSVVRSDGYYLLWYIRSQKRLALSISHLSKIVHYEIRTKVNNGKLLYYIFPDTVQPDVRLLLQYHESHGLRPQSKQEDTETGFPSPNGRDSRRYSHVFMKCPVLVEYGPRLAFSV